MVKKIKKEIVEFPYWMWTKRIFWSVLILAIVYGAGTFYPNPLAKKWANEELRQEHTKWAQNLGLVSKEMKYKTKKEFIKELGYCVDYINFTTPVDKRVPIEMLVGQAVLESGWGQSRFAKEANNLFGIRVFKSTAPHLLPLGVEKWQGWGVRVFKTKCDSVKEYIRLLNEHPAYEDFRTLRAQMQATNQPLDSVKLIKTLKAFSTTTDYASRVINMMSKIEKELSSK
jgi:Bax protein